MLATINETRTHLALDKDEPVFLAQFSEPVWSGHLPSWGDFITATSGFRFSVYTAGREKFFADRRATRTREVGCSRLEGDQTVGVVASFLIRRLRNWVRDRESWACKAM